jgi:hypothetical protein
MCPTNHHKEEEEEEGGGREDEEGDRNTIHMSGNKVSCRRSKL